MNLQELIKRTNQPDAFMEDRSIPWDRPDFSARMLKEHLSQTHDMASRRQHIIQNQTQWIHQTILREKPANILELGSGPGIYTNLLAGLGHKCTGIDFSPAALEYAQKQAAQTGAHCEYILHDLITAQYGTGFDLVMMLFGDFHAKTKTDALTILKKIAASLKPGGMLLLELIPMNIIKANGQTKPTWSTKTEGIFSPQPHIILNDYHWDEEKKTAVSQYYILDPVTATIETYANQLQAYTPEELTALLTETGFTIRERFDMLGTIKDNTGLDLYGLAAQKRGA